MGVENAVRYLCAVVVRIVLEWTIPRLTTIARMRRRPHRYHIVSPEMALIGPNLY